MALQDLIVPLGISGGIASAVTFTAWKLFSRFYVPVPPNRALVLYGGRSLPSDAARGAAGIELHPPRIFVGGGAYVPPWRSRAAFLSLEPVDVNVAVSVAATGKSTTASGWQVRVALQVKIPAEPGMLRAAAENLLGKDEEAVRALVGRVVAGAVPTVLAGRDVDGLTDWDGLASEIQAAAARDLVVDGLAIRSLSLTELRPAAVDGESLSLEMQPAGQEPDGRLGRLEARLDRTERSLGSLGAEVVRMVRDGNLFRDPPELPPQDPARSELRLPRRRAALSGAVEGGGGR